MDNAPDLARFIDAQAGTYEAARDELRSGRKLSHWMWFMFPQVAGLGGSPTAAHYAIGSEAEARAYAQNPLLGARLVELTKLVLEHAGTDIREIFGHIDAMKFRSSMTLFRAVCPEQACFGQAIELFYDGDPCAPTLEFLERGAS